MPEHLNATPQVGGEPGRGQGQGTPEPEGTPDTFLGTYTTKEEAEKGIKEKDAAIAKLAGEVGHLKASKDTQQKMADILGELAKANKTADTPAGPNWDSVKDNLKKALDDGDPEYLLATLQNVVADTAGKGDVAKVEQTMAERLAQMEDAIQSIHPDFLAHADTFAELKEQFPHLGRGDLTKMAMVVDSHKPVAPPADTPPGSTHSSRVSEPQSSTVQLSQAQIDMLNSAIPGGLRPGELENYKGGRG